MLARVPGGRGRRPGAGRRSRGRRGGGPRISSSSWRARAAGPACRSAGRGAASRARSRRSRAMLPRLTLGPRWRSSHVCCDCCGASKMTVSRPSARTIASTRSACTSPWSSNSPTVPLSRPSPITQHRAGREVAEHLLDPLGRPPRASTLLLPTSAMTVNSAASSAMISRLRSARDRQRPVGHLDVVDPELPQPLDVAVEAALVHGDLQQRAARADPHAGLPAQRDLLAHAAAHVRRAPAELDQVDVRPGGLEQRLERQRRHPAVEDVRDPRAPRLRRPLRQVQEVAAHGVSWYCREDVTPYAEGGHDLGRRAGRVPRRTRPDRGTSMPSGTAQDGPNSSRTDAARTATGGEPLGRPTSPSGCTTSNDGRPTAAVRPAPRGAIRGCKSPGAAVLPRVRVARDCVDASLLPHH